MPRFSVTTLKSHNVFGEGLRAAREERGLELTDVSRRLKLPLKYLVALEVGAWHDLPAGSYARLFARTYAEFLGVSADAIDQELPRPTASAAQTKRSDTRAATKQVGYGRRFVLMAAALTVLTYLGWQAWHTLLPPTLQLAQPAEALTTFAPTVTVSGTTSVGTKVTVNGEVVEVASSGRFQVDIALAPGLNTITVMAQKSYTKPVTEVRHVLFTPPAAAPPNQGL